MSIDYRLSIHGPAEYRQGHLEDAAMRLEQAMAIARRTQRDPQGGVLAALPAPTLALVRREQDRVAEAGRINAEHFDINRRVAPIEGLYSAYLVAARVARLDGQSVRAHCLLDEGESIAAARGWRRAVVVLGLERLRLLPAGRPGCRGRCRDRQPGGDAIARGRAVRHWSAATSPRWRPSPGVGTAWPTASPA